MSILSASIIFGMALINPSTLDVTVFNCSLKSFDKFSFSIKFTNACNQRWKSLCIVVSKFLKVKETKLAIQHFYYHGVQFKIVPMINPGKLEIHLFVQDLSLPLLKGM